MKILWSELTKLSVASLYRLEEAMIAAVVKKAAWKLPDLRTAHHCEELGLMTLGQINSAM